MCKKMRLVMIPLLVMLVVVDGLLLLDYYYWTLMVFGLGCLFGDW